MFYYIENQAFICKSETEIKVGEDTKVIELKTDLINPFYENGKIIEYSESEKFKLEQVEAEKLENEKLEAERIESEKVENERIAFENSIENKIQKINSETRERILSRYSETDQANMSARIVEINTLAKLEGDRAFTNDEILEIQKAQYMFNWIREQRKLCAEEINKISI